MVKYSLTICGGTFDVLHKGHKDFLNKILKVSEKVFLGLTSDHYVRVHKPARGIASFEKRKKELAEFLKEIGVQNRVQIGAIDNIYGPLLDPNFKANALAVTNDTYNSALQINLKRKKKFLAPLKIIKIPITKDYKGKTLSTTRIKQGYVNRGGKLILTLSLRRQLQKPLGELIKEVPDDIDVSRVITVGDITTKNFFEKGLIPRLAIIDFLVNRKPIPHKTFKNLKTIEVSNPAGTVSFELFEAIKNSLKGSIRKVIIVEGEEDLAVLPAIVFAPIGFEVYYGQPDQGLVKIKITTGTKNKAKLLLSSFEGV